LLKKKIRVDLVRFSTSDASRRESAQNCAIRPRPFVRDDIGNEQGKKMDGGQANEPSKNR